MSGKLFELDEAARLLGVTPDQLNEMRTRSEIFGYRDGATWKFKIEELERVADERGFKLGEAPPPVDDLGDATLNTDLGSLLADEEDSIDQGAESILVSDETLGAPHGGPSSTVIGKTDGAGGSEDSDLRLAGDSGKLADEAGHSDLKLGDDEELQLSDDNPPSDVKLAGSDVALGEGSDLQLGGSDLKLGGSDLDLAGSDVLGSKGPEDTSKGGGSSLSLDDDDDEALEIGSDVGLGDEDLALGEDLDLALSGGSGVELGDDDDGDLVLGGGSDVALNASDSGINLSSPIDSGLSLEEPLDLGGSSVSGLELPSDDEILLEEELADPEAATQLKGDDAFLLEPVGPAMDDDSDSGSQVIALDTEELDAEAATQLGMGGAIAAEQAGMAAPMTVGAGVAGAGAPQAGYAPEYAPQPAQLPEAPYSIWQILSLSIVTLLIAFTGMLMVDVVRNIWSFDQPYSASSSMIEMVLGIVGQQK